MKAGDKERTPRQYAHVDTWFKPAIHVVVYNDLLHVRNFRISDVDYMSCRVSESHSSEAINSVIPNE